MIRLTCMEKDNQRTRLFVEGRVTRETMKQLKTACEAYREEAGELTLDLAGVSFVDEAAARGLRNLGSNGVVVAGATGFVAEMLRVQAKSGRLSTTRKAPSKKARVEARANDDELHERLRAGEPAAYETLVRRYGGRLLATARRLLRNEEDAREVVQEAYLSVVRGIDGFSGDSQLSTWLHRIVVNAALMKIRSRKRRPEEAIEDLLPRFDDTGHRVIGAEELGENSETLLLRAESRVMVRKAIDRLPESYRTVLMLRDIEDLTTQEVADRLGMTANAVKVRLHRARQALRTLITQEIDR